MFAYIGFQLEDSYLTNAQKWCRAEELQEERRDKWQPFRKTYT